MCAGERVEFASRVIDGLLVAGAVFAVIGLASLLLACGPTPPTVEPSGGSLHGMVAIDVGGESYTIDLDAGTVLGEGADVVLREYLVELQLDATVDAMPASVVLSSHGSPADSGDLVHCAGGSFTIEGTTVRVTVPISSACPPASAEVVYTQQ